MTSIINFLAQIFGGHLSAITAELGFKSALEVAKFLAWKTIIVFLLFSASITIVSNILYFVFDKIFTLIGDKMGSVGSVSNMVTSISVADFGAYLMQSTGLVQCLTMLLSAVAVRYALNFIPFSRV